MVYQDFFSWLQSLRPVVLEAVEQTERAFREGMRPEELPPDDKLPFSEPVWRAYCQNTYKLMGVKRITGSPYATHPTRMACTALRLIPDDREKELTAIYTLFHDYLEEGDGRTREGVDKFYREYPGHDDVVVAAVVLSEPEIDYEHFPERRKAMENVAYVAQILMMKPFLKETGFYNAALADKLDNIHDLDYITENHRYTPEKKRSRLQEKFGYFHFVLDAIGHEANSDLRATLKSAIENVSSQHNFTMTEVEEAARRLSNLLAQYREDLKRMIEAYHRELGFHWAK